MLRAIAGRAVFAACLSISVAAAHAQSVQTVQPRMIQSETTFTRSDGALVRFVPSEYDGPSVASASSSSTPTEDDIKPCLTRTYSDWNGWSPCNIEDRLLASTDFGLGHRIRLDGVTSH
jgi:hypothetical protein